MLLGAIPRRRTDEERVKMGATGKPLRKKRERKRFPEVLGIPSGRFSESQDLLPGVKFSLSRMFLFVVAACIVAPGGTARAADVELRSSWAASSGRVWAGPEYWANPLQDWRTRDGRLECINAAADRNVHLLTYQLASTSELAMRVTVGKLSAEVGGWAGFRFGSRGKMNDYRHNVVFGKGTDAGITHDGKLFIGDASKTAQFEGEATLELTLRPSDSGHRATLTLLDARGGSAGAVTATVPSGRVAGNLALVSHGKGAKGPAYYFKDWTVRGKNLVGGEEQNWGPILWTQYTLSRGVMKLSAQFPPMGPDDPRIAKLQVKSEGRWMDAARATIDDVARVALFRIPKWDATKDVSYRVVYRWKGKDFTFEGKVRRDPADKAELSVAGFTGNKDYGFPNREIVGNVAKLDPDMLFFSGDQIYESVAGYGIVRDPVDAATLDYLRKWYLFGWSFRDVLKDRPSVILPDDHDVYQGNLWGANGRKLTARSETTDKKKFKAGGYAMPPEWVNMVQRTQTAHLPDPYDPKPVLQGIGVYYTDMVYGRVGFAILEDRKFKSGATEFKDDTLEAVLLGARQIEFLRNWVADWVGTDMKATLSQTVFAQCHTHGGNPKKPNRKPRDPNAWPPEARNRALRVIRKAFAFMYAGDNHLPTVVHHGVDEWEDAGVSFTVPSIAAGFPRAWWPGKASYLRSAGMPDYAESLPGRSRDYAGRFRDAWGHPITVLAAANPRVFKRHGQTPPGDVRLLDLKSSGFGLVRFDKAERKISVECYRILADLNDPTSAQFPDWPVVIDQQDNYARKAVAHLPELKVVGLSDPVVQVIDESSGELVYALRIKGASFLPKVFAEGRYTILVGEQPDRMKKLSGIQAVKGPPAKTLAVTFD